MENFSAVPLGACIHKMSMSIISKQNNLIQGCQLACNAPVPRFYYALVTCTPRNDVLALSLKDLRWGWGGCRRAARDSRLHSLRWPNSSLSKTLRESTQGTHDDAAQDVRAAERICLVDYTATSSGNSRKNRTNTETTENASHTRQFLPCVVRSTSFLSVRTKVL